MKHTKQIAYIFILLVFSSSLVAKEKFQKKLSCKITKIDGQFASYGPELKNGDEIIIDTKSSKIDRLQFKSNAYVPSTIPLERQPSTPDTSHKATYRSERKYKDGTVMYVQFTINKITSGYAGKIQSIYRQFHDGLYSVEQIDLNCQLVK